MTNPVVKEYFYEKLLKMMGVSDTEAAASDTSGVSSAKATLKRLEGLLIKHYEMKLLVMALLFWAVLIAINSVTGRDYWLVVIIYGFIAISIIFINRVKFFSEVSDFRRYRHHTSNLEDAYDAAINFKMRKINSERLSFILVSGIGILSAILLIFQLIPLWLAVFLIADTIFFCFFLYFRLKKNLEKLALGH